MPIMNPFLIDSISNMLMEDGIEDATCSQLDGSASYQAIFRSFYDIISEHPGPPKSSVDSSSCCENPYALHFPCQIPADKHHIMRYNGVNTLTHQMLNSGASQETLFQTESTADTSRLVVHALALPNSANLNAFDTTKAQSSHAAIEFDDGDLMDTQSSCWKKHKVLTNSRSCRGRGMKEHGIALALAHSRLSSAFKEFSLKFTGVEISFADLKLHDDDYAALYVTVPGIPTGAPNKEKGLAVAGKSGKSGKNRIADAHEYVDLKELIVSCAEAVAVGDARGANEIFRELRQVHGASAHGNGSQRVAHYFSEALGARLSGTGGGHHFRAVLDKMPSAATLLKVYKLWFDVCPIMKSIHYVANQCILKAAEQGSRLHIVDYGIEHVTQWAFLINALADQKGGPPLLVITSIDSPQSGVNPAERLEEIGRRLAAYARTYNVPFQYHAIVSSNWEGLDSSSFHFHEDEVLVVNCIECLRHLPDENVNFVSSRQKFLTSIHSLKPHLFITADVSAAYNSSFFVSRFREALYYYSNIFDMIATVWHDIPERHLTESNRLYCNILNIVACEGAERVERPETYKQWQVRIKRAGFEHLLIHPAILSRLSSHVKQHYHKDLFVHDDANKWILLGWKGRIVVGMSAWKPGHVKS